MYIVVIYNRLLKKHVNQIQGPHEDKGVSEQSRMVPAVDDLVCSFTLLCIR